MDVIADTETPHWKAGLDLRACYTAQQRETLGEDAAELSGWADTLLWTLAALRSGIWGEGHRYGHAPADMDWAIAISELAQLGEHVADVLDHAIVQHAQAGGSIQQLADAAGLSARSTAQGRRDAARRRVTKGGPLDGWATLRPESGSTKEQEG